MTPEISCERCRDYLMEFTANLLPPAMDAAVARHLATCADCQREYATWRALNYAIRERAHATPDDTGAAAGWARLEAALTGQTDHPAAPIQPTQVTPQTTAPSGASPKVMSVTMPPSVNRKDRERAMTPNDPDNMVIESLRQAQAHRDTPGLATGTRPARQSPPTSSPARRPRRVWYGVVPTIAAVLLITLSVALFGGLRLSRGGGAPPTGQPGASCAPSDITASFPTSGALDGPFFDGVQMLSPTDGWALGMYQTGSLSKRLDHSFILHFANCHWGAVINPVPNDDLSSLSMVSATNGWALGSVRSSDAQVVLHYIGDAWHIVTLPVNIGVPNALSTPHYSSLTMVSATEGWLTTAYRDQSSTEQGDVFHELNGQWRRVQLPNDIPAFNVTPSVTPIGRDQAWILDNNYDVLLYAHGQVTTTYTLPFTMNVANPDLAGAAAIHAPAPNDAWLSYFTAPNFLALPTSRTIMHYDGSSWSRSALSENTQLQSAATVAVLSANDGWAFISGPLPLLTLASMTNCPDSRQGAIVVSALRLHDGQWQRAPFQPQNIGCIGNVTRVSANEYWAVGTFLAKDAHSVQSSTGSQALLHEVDGVWTVYGG